MSDACGRGVAPGARRENPRADVEEDGADALAPACGIIVALALALPFWAEIGFLIFG